jgi:ubiquinone/menaquinone biosynthesis C-methylase UbiE
MLPRMNTYERGTVVDIGGGDGSGILNWANQSPGMMFYVVDSVPSVIQPRYNNVRFIDQLIDFGTVLPFPDKSVDVVKMNFLMGELNRETINASDSFEEALYCVAVTEARRVLVDDGVVQITEVRGNLRKAATVFFECGFYIFSSAVVAGRGASWYTDYFFDIFDRSGRSPEESKVLPMYFEAKKFFLPGRYGDT